MRRGRRGSTKKGRVRGLRIPRVRWGTVVCSWRKQVDCLAKVRRTQLAVRIGWTTRGEKCSSPNRQSCDNPCRASAVVDNIFIFVASSNRIGQTSIDGSLHCVVHRCSTRVWRNGLRATETVIDHGGNRRVVLSVVTRYPVDSGDG